MSSENNNKGNNNVCPSICPACGSKHNVYLQHSVNSRPPIALAECRNEGCTHYFVTRSPQFFREVVAGMHRDEWEGFADKGKQAAKSLQGYLAKIRASRK